MATALAQPLDPRAAPLPASASVASNNWRDNRRALEQTQPRLAAALEAAPSDLRWVYARDGSLTAFDAAGQWLGRCSVPLRAAEAMLTTLDVKGRVACLLAPMLAAPVRVTLDRSRRDQAVLALCPDLAELRALLHCADFSPEIRAHRLWFAWGDAWPAALAQLFADRPGLATPAQFVRLPTTPPEQVEALVSAAQKVFAETNSTRAAAIATRRDAWRPSRRSPSPGTPGDASGIGDFPRAASGIGDCPRAGWGAGFPSCIRLSVIAPSTFKLWADAGAVLASTLSQSSADADATIIPFDPDTPSNSSALALLEAAWSCDALVAADTARADLPNVLPPDMPWITWVTTPAIPSRAAAGPRDALLVADPGWRDAAIASGWPAEAVGVAGWPALAPSAGAPHQVTALALITDTRPVVAPEKLSEYSSHQLLWNAIAAELSGDPFALGDDPAAYLDARMRRYGVSPDCFDAALFLTALILPAFEQSLARLLLAEGFPLRLHGHGWDELPGFRPHAAGPVHSRAALGRVIAESVALIHPLPTLHAHPADALGLLAIRPGGANRGSYLRSLRAALAKGRPSTTPADALTLRAVISHLIR